METYMILIAAIVATLVSAGLVYCIGSYVFPTIVKIWKDFIYHEEATYKDIGQLCKFWDEEKTLTIYSVLKAIEADGFVSEFQTKTNWKHCSPLTKIEAELIENDSFEFQDD